MILRNRLPKVSIIFPINKWGRFTNDSLDSILALEVPRPLSIELVIIKDGIDSESFNSKLNSFIRSTATVEWLKVEVLNLVRNEGQSIARNYGIKKCRGEFICYLDSDDCFDQLRILTALDSITNIDPSAEGVISQYEIIQWDQSKNRKLKTHKILNLRTKGNELEIVKNKKLSFLLPFMHRKSLYDKIVDKYGHFFVPGLVDLEEKVLFRRIIEQGIKLTYCNKPAGTINLSPDGQLAKKKLARNFRSFVLDISHKDGASGQYLDKVKDFADLVKIAMPKLKVCNVCRQTLPIDNFGPWAYSRDLRKNHCKLCAAEMEAKRQKKLKKKKK